MQMRNAARRALGEHLDVIHAARLMVVADLLPEADEILDLGGANAPLYAMGYPHPFRRLTLVDLPKEERHEMYAHIDVSAAGVAGEVRILYADMTRLPMVEDASVDLVWSGQSIEHVLEAAGQSMCVEAFRVLRPGGWFCLDTPNGLISSIHAATANLAMIHPEHCIEYRPIALQAMLVNAGFRIETALGVRHMPRTSGSGNFDYADFLTGAAISDDVEGSYIQFYRCRKPG